MSKLEARVLNAEATILALFECVEGNMDFVKDIRELKSLFLDGAENNGSIVREALNRE